MKSDRATSGYLSGQLLVAMPAMTDPRFERTVIYICVHNEDGAMGLVVNRLMDSLTFGELLDQLDITAKNQADDMRIHFGGPVESGRGFVLHSSDYAKEGTITMENGVGLTATIDILRDIAEGDGPRESMLALGYAGWGPGQLDNEIQQNVWLNVPADDDLVFDTDLETKWRRSLAKLGIDVTLLSGQAGHA
ncbi:MAG: YqgE/AlgH family protein [Alphaproteobacteria bacterium]|nr:YqgE/AlgH family protein [Alphaproteobacteria bacterium]